MDSNDLLDEINKLKPKMGKLQYSDVKKLLNDVWESMREYENRLSQQKAKISELEKQNDSYQKNMAYLKDAVINAEYLADQILNEAKSLAIEISANAEAESARLLEEARKTADEIITEAQRKAVDDNARLLEDTASFRLELSRMKNSLYYLENKAKSFIQSKIDANRQ
ncbi:MAG TPA: DivIVA domain-containing protein [Clostridia bacterium]|nr:DivIVA domain-containing protein [Clostridia bacterium]